jgi:hypothetical protein
MYEATMWAAMYASVHCPNGILILHLVVIGFSIFYILHHSDKVLQGNPKSPPFSVVTSSLE